MKQWAEFYRSREPDRYLRYAQRRYEAFISVVQAFVAPGDHVVEAGCGMGTISRALYDNGCPARRFTLVDSCPEMLGMAAHNTRYFGEDKVRLYGQDIQVLDFDKRIERPDVVHSHGVLEHFSDFLIQNIVHTQQRMGARALVHYVPGEKYSTPSFGDERLMPVWEWKRILGDQWQVIPFNDGFDYILMWRTQ